MTTLYLVRHGETWANVKQRKQGILDTALTDLTPKGRQQAREFGARFDLAQVDRLVVSPLKRTRETAALILGTTTVPLTQDARLRELSYGQWNGQRTATLMAAHPGAFDPVVGEIRPEAMVLAEGEPLQQAHRRVAEFMTSAARQWPAETILVVTHGWVIKSMVLQTLGLTDEMRMGDPDNLSLTKLQVDTSDASYLCFYNRLY